jgi:hypothetical protein
MAKLVVAIACEPVAAALEQLRQRPFALRRIEDVFLLDLHPRQRGAEYRLSS